MSHKNRAARLTRKKIFTSHENNRCIPFYMTIVFVIRDVRQEVGQDVGQRIAQAGCGRRESGNMPRRISTTPTEAEVEILQVLWEKGPCTVRQIYNVLKDRRGTGYSSTLKIIQLMTEKGLLSKDESVRPQVFTPSQPQEQIQLQLVDDLIQRGFGGSAMSLVLRAVTGNRITPLELAQMRSLIGKAKGGRK
jgi:BlaI family transcriptional regulator, penicillinase repressor